MPVEQITSVSHFDSVVGTGKLVVVDFFATWCGPCKAIAPEFESMSASYPPSHALFCKVDVDQLQELAQRYDVTAMPTFVLIKGGSVLQKIRGADLNSVRREVENNIRAAAASSSGDANALVAKLADGRSNPAAALEAYSMLESTTPVGSALIPLLASNAYDPAMLDALVKALRSQGENGEQKAVLLVHTLHNFVTSSLSWKTTKDPVNEVERLVSIYRNILATPTAQEILLKSSKFIPKFAGSGKEFMMRSSLGSVFGVGMFQNRNLHHANIVEVMKMFPCTEPGKLNEMAESKSKADVQMSLTSSVDRNFQVARALLAPAPREHTLKWFSAALEANAGYGKEMSNESELANSDVMVSLAFVALELAMPVINGDFMQNIPVAYTYDPNAIVKFGKEVERVSHFTEDDLPKVDGVSAYKPTVHLFFLAIRALHLTQSAMLLKIQSQMRQIGHPDMDARSKMYLAAHVALSKSLLTSPELAKKSVTFFNGVARWLTTLLQVRPDGTLNAEPSLAWRLVPQEIIDDVVRCTKLITALRLQIDPYLFVDILGLMLILMGNLTYFPKAHTHALFPELLVTFIKNDHLRRVLENHPWYTVNIVRGAIQTYIAMEKCEYERAESRYYLSLVLTDLLKDTYLCVPVREEFEREGDQTLERFTSMVTAETNKAMDSVLESLKQMNEAEIANNGQPPQNNEKYEENGHHLKSGLLLYNATVEVFMTLSDQFPAGVQQHLVAQQISSMLTKSLVKLAGPNSKDLKVADPAKYEFKPRELLGNTVECFTKFRTHRGFARCVCESGVPLPDVHYAINNVINPQRTLVPSQLVGPLAQMRDDIAAAEKETAEDMDFWDDAPEFALCALMSDPLNDPIALPSDGEDLIFVNREAIQHHLLSEAVNPFNRQALTVDELSEFNARDDIVARITGLKKQISEWVEEKKRNQQ